jgi:transcriptional regulator with XRE-family HTH domain
MAERSNTTQYLHDVGKRIKSLRTERGYTLADLGENIGLDKSNTFRIEQGKNFTLLTLVKIAAFLNVHPKDILEVQFTTQFKHVENDIAEKRKKRQKNVLLKKTATKTSVKPLKPYLKESPTKAIAADTAKKRKRS